MFSELRKWSDYPIVIHLFRDWVLFKEFITHLDYILQLLGAWWVLFFMRRLYNNGFMISFCWFSVPKLTTLGRIRTWFSLLYNYANLWANQFVDLRRISTPALPSVSAIQSLKGYIAVIVYFWVKFSHEYIILDWPIETWFFVLCDERWCSHPIRKVPFYHRPQTVFQEEGAQ